MTTDLPLDVDLAHRYASSATTADDSLRVERAMDGSAQWRALVGSQIETGRLERNLAGVAAELDAPKRGVLERSMGRLGLPEHVARLMAATPVLRRSWYLATFLVLFFGVSASSADRAGSVSLFLALAPLVPVLGVGMAYGPGIDPSHDMTAATPLSGFRLLLLRSIAVLATSVAFGGVASLLAASEHGTRVVAWMLPALALTSVTLALSTFVPTRVAAGVTGGAWLLAVTVVSQAADDFTMFGNVAQPLYVALAAVATGVLFLRRATFDAAEATHA